jgi:hypothetical protein
MSRLSGIAAIVVLLLSSDSQADNSYAGQRLFHTADERLTLDAGRELPAVTIEPEMELPAPERPPSKVPEPQPVSFDGIVIRHTKTAPASAITWVNGKSGDPSVWRANKLDEYRLVIERYGKILALKVGEQQLVQVPRSQDEVQ